MLNWPFLLFAAAFGWFYGLHFVFARRAWKRIRGRRMTEIDQHYVRLENYFGQSFRTKVRDWLTLPEAGESTWYLRTIRKGNELILEFGAAESPEGSAADEILVVNGDFSCGRNSRFGREILVHGNCRIGRGTRVQALAVDGALALGPESRVVRWVDAAGPIELSGGASVQSRVYSASSIRLDSGVRVKSLCAPRIVAGRERDPEPAAEQAPENALQIPGGAAGRGFDPERLRRQGEDSWVYSGDLQPERPVRITERLIVRGSFSAPEGSRIEAGVKAAGNVTLGRLSAVRANLVAGRDLLIGPGCVFEGVLWAGGSMRLREGTRGRPAEAGVVAYAARDLTLEDNVVVQGKVCAGGWVIAAAFQADPSDAPEHAGAPVPAAGEGA